MSSLTVWVAIFLARLLDNNHSNTPTQSKMARSKKTSRARKVAKADGTAAGSAGATDVAGIVGTLHRSLPTLQPWTTSPEHLS